MGKHGSCVMPTIGFSRGTAERHRASGDGEGLVPVDQGLTGTCPVAGPESRLSPRSPNEQTTRRPGLLLMSLPYPNHWTPVAPSDQLADAVPLCLVEVRPIAGKVFSDLLPRHVDKTMMNRLPLMTPRGASGRLPDYY
jgi:hypothetical protein